MTNGGVIRYLDFVPFLFKACRNLPKGVFANFINKIDVGELICHDEYHDQLQVTRFFICQKLFLLISYSRIDLVNLALRTEAKELQMDVLIMHLEESLEIKISKQDIAVLKKEFDNYFLVPLAVLEAKIAFYTSHESALRQRSPVFEISQLVIMNRILLEWDAYQSSNKRRLLKKFIDFDLNNDGVLSLEEFKELMRGLEGPAVSIERVVLLFKEAVDLSNEHEQMLIQNDPEKMNGGRGALIDKISPECFVETIVKNRVGGYGFEFLDFEYLYS